MELFSSLKNYRLRSLEQSFNVNDQPFPVSLLLIGKEGDKEILIGHSKILSVPYDIAKCFVESGKDKDLLSVIALQNYTT